ncbi:MAG: TIGR01777 family oxidoreductase [Candidatus Obscuribacterales bacterium]|nr:TIGR01777 family oxidoreductase [Candidatus Obscuribacterales bacterium]
MKILLSGATGLIGTETASRLLAKGHQVTRLVRSSATSGDITWHPENGELDCSQLEGFDAVVHLAGENVAQRWNDEIKAKIRNSRVQGTRLLAQCLAGLKNPPKVFVCASAIGFYGDRGSETLTENSYAGTGFLSAVCKDWEDATLPASQKGIRTVNLRIGVVLSTKGGALAKMLPPFQLGGGGILGNGKQYMSWITLEDMSDVILFSIENDKLEGPVNAVAPTPVTNAQFTQALGKTLGRPTILPVPSFAVQLLFGQMADELLLGGAKVLPAKLEANGFQFRHGQIEEALRHTLAKN